MSGSWLASPVASIDQHSIKSCKVVCMLHGCMIHVCSENTTFDWRYYNTSGRMYYLITAATQHFVSTGKICQLYLVFKLNYFTRMSLRKVWILTCCAMVNITIKKVLLTGKCYIPYVTLNTVHMYCKNDWVRGFQVLQRCSESAIACLEFKLVQCGIHNWP